jgi:splicing factor 45
MAMDPLLSKRRINQSMYQAVNALKGRIFNGNTIAPKYFDSQRFEQGIYS